MFVALLVVAAKVFPRSPGATVLAAAFLILWQVLEILPRSVDYFAFALGYADSYLAGGMNKAAIEAELQKRVDSGEVERENQARQQKEHEKEQGHRKFARRSKQWLGLYMMGAPLILISAGTKMPPGLGWLAYVAYGLCALYTGVSVLAGYGLWKRKEWGRRLAIGVFVPQLLSIQSSAFVYSLTSALSGFFYISFPGHLEFGVSAFITTGSFQFVIGDLPLSFSLAVNVVTVFFIWLLVKARLPVDGEEDGINTRPEGWSD